MRIYLKLTANNELVPFNYQKDLVRSFHKWLGYNPIHNELSLYSFSWLSQGQIKGQGFTFPKGAIWFISTWDINLMKSLISNIRKYPNVAYGMTVNEVIVKEAPDFSSIDNFQIATPIFIKRTIGREVKFYYYDDPDAGNYLTETLKHKMSKAGLNDDLLQVSFDTSYSRKSTKMIDYDGVKNKASWCPVIIHGNNESKAFAWHVGLGNSTGIGFGALI